MKHVELGVYRHYKGNYYLVTGTAHHTETQEELVVYQSLYGGFQFWVRPIAMFLDDSVAYNGSAYQRFKRVADSSDAEKFKNKQDCVVSITFRPLLVTDFPLLVQWLNEPHVRRWWNVGCEKPITFEGVTKKLLPRINGDEAVYCYIIETNAVPIGYIQVYDARAFSREGYELSLLNAHIKDIDRLASIDLYIGDSKYVGKGYGFHVIQQFLHEKVEHEYGACIVDSDVENKASIRAFEKAGFNKLVLLSLSNGTTAVAMLKQWGSGKKL